jgi:hypothetical protein
MPQVSGRAELVPLVDSQSYAEGYDGYETPSASASTTTRTLHRVKVQKKHRKYCFTNLKGHEVETKLSDWKARIADGNIEGRATRISLKVYLEIAAEGRVCLPTERSGGCRERAFRPWSWRTFRCLVYV